MADERNNRGRNDNRRPHRDGDLTYLQKDWLRKLAGVKIQQMVGLLKHHGLDVVLANPQYVEAFLDPKAVSIFPPEDTHEKHAQAIREYQSVLDDPKCLAVARPIADMAAIKYAMKFGNTLIVVASFSYMPYYDELARLVIQLGHDAGYRPPEKESFKWEDFQAAVKGWLSYDEYLSVLAEANRLFEIAVPRTEETIFDVAIRDTRLLDLLKRCAPARPKPEEAPKVNEKPPVNIPLAREGLEPGHLMDLDEEKGDDNLSPEPLNEEELKEPLENQTDPVPASPATMERSMDDIPF